MLSANLHCLNAQKCRARCFQIPCIHHLPGVGENMQSHFGLGGIDFLTKKKPGLTLGHFVNLKSLKNYIKHRTGELWDHRTQNRRVVGSSNTEQASYGIIAHRTGELWDHRTQNRRVVGPLRAEQASCGIIAQCAMCTCTKTCSMPCIKSEHHHRLI